MFFFCNREKKKKKKKNERKNVFEEIENKNWYWIVNDKNGISCVNN